MNRKTCITAGQTYCIGDAVPGGMPLVEDIYTVGPERWFVVQTNPNCERRAEGGLREAGLTTYLPKVSQWRKIPRPLPRGPQKREVERPLFPGYLFIASNRRAGPPWLKVAATDGVRRVLGVQGAKMDVPVTVLTHVRDVEAEARRQFERPADAFAAGEVVCITDGPFAQFTATFVAMSDDERVRVLVGLLGRSTEIGLPLASVRRVA